MRTIYYHSSEKKALYRLTGQFFKAGSPRSIQQQMQAERKRANRLVPGHAAVRRHTIDLAVRAALNLQIINPQAIDPQSADFGKRLLVCAIHGHMPLMDHSNFRKNVLLPDKKKAGQPEQEQPRRPVTVQLRMELF